ncbi:MAG: hypothetical protein Q9173_006287, partial [Seirophora scorigena]
YGLPYYLAMLSQPPESLLPKYTSLPTIQENRRSVISEWIALAAEARLRCALESRVPQRSDSDSKELVPPRRLVNLYPLFAKDFPALGFTATWRLCRHPTGAQATRLDVST